MTSTFQSNVALIKLQHLVHSFLNEDLPVNRSELAETLNTLITRINKVLNIPIAEPKFSRISIFDKKKYYNEDAAQTNPKRICIYRPSSEIPHVKVIIMDFNVFNNDRYRALILLFEAMKYILFFRSQPHYVISPQQIAEKLALAFLFELVPNKSDKDFLMKNWANLSPPVPFSPTNQFVLKDYFLSIHQAVPQEYTRYMLNHLFTRQIRFNDCFSFRFSPYSLSDLERQVFMKAIYLNTFSAKEIHQTLELSQRHIQRILTKLKALYLLRFRWQLNLSAISLGSYFLMFHLPKEKIWQLKKYRDPSLRSAFLYNKIIMGGDHEKELLLIMNYYFPVHDYARKKIKQWANEFFEVIPKTRKKHVTAEFEVFPNRVYVQHPAAMFTDNPEALEIKQNITLPAPSPKLQLTPQQRSIALIMYMKGYRTLDELYSHVKSLDDTERKQLHLTKNRNTISSALSFLKEKKIIAKQVVMPFFEELHRLFLYAPNVSQEQYQDLINKLVPFTVLQNTAHLENNSALCFLGVKKTKIQALHDFIREEYPTALLASNPTTLETTPKLRLIPSEQSWKFKKPQPIFSTST